MVVHMYTDLRSELHVDLDLHNILDDDSHPFHLLTGHVPANAEKRQQQQQKTEHGACMIKKGSGSVSYKLTMAVWQVICTNMPSRRTRPPSQITIDGSNVTFKI